MSRCEICPRQCGVDRVKGVGFCHATEQVEVAAVCRHVGEEPPLCGMRGICNVFFAHCNLQCVFCQNNEISGSDVDKSLIRLHSWEDVVNQIAAVLKECENVVGLVSPTQYAYAIPAIVEGLHDRGLYPTIVYNTNAYERIETLRMVEPYVDVYLPDMKYMDDVLAGRYSRASDYPAIASAAIKEMVRQKGGGLICDEEGVAFRGIIVRHLVLPGQMENTKSVLRWISEELPYNIHVSLMAQYFPNKAELPDELGRPLCQEEYDEVVRFMEQCGLDFGWTQQMNSNENYRPSFGKEAIFE